MSFNSVITGFLQKLFDIFRIVCKTAGRGQSACVDGMVVFGRKSEFYGRGGINNGFQSADIVENVGSDKSVSLRFLQQPRNNVGFNQFFVDSFLRAWASIFRRYPRRQAGCQRPDKPGQQAPCRSQDPQGCLQQVP